MPEKLAIDISFLKLILAMLGSAFAGGYTVFRMLRRLIQEDVKTLNIKVEKIKKDIAECEDNHVYQDEFNRVADQVKAIYEHLLGKKS